MKRIVISFIIIALLSIAGCTETSQTPSPKDLKSDFQKIMNEKTSPQELMDFANNHISVLPKESASRLVLRLESIQREQIEARTDTLLKPDTQTALQQFDFNSSLDEMIASARDEKLLVILKETKANGFKIIPLEGNYYPIIDYEQYQIYQPYVNEDIKAYIDIAASESTQACLNDAAMTITWPELARRALRSEKFITQYPDSARIDDVRQQHDIYVTTYLYGANNTPAFDYDTKILNQKARQSYYETAKSSGQIAEVIKQYLTVLEKNQYKRTPEVEQYLKDAEKTLQSTK